MLFDFHLSFVVTSFLFRIFLVWSPAIVLYYFNTHLVLIHYWSLGWTKGHCIRATILRLSAAWHSCSREKLYQLWNQPAATSKSNQLSHWKAFCSIAINGLLVTRMGCEWGCKELLVPRLLISLKLSAFCLRLIYFYIYWLWCWWGSAFILKCAQLDSYFFKTYRSITCRALLISSVFLASLYLHVSYLWWQLRESRRGVFVTPGGSVSPGHMDN